MVYVWAVIPGMTLNPGTNWCTKDHVWHLGYQSFPGRLSLNLVQDLFHLKAYRLSPPWKTSVGAVNVPFSEERFLCWLKFVFRPIHWSLARYFILYCCGSHVQLPTNCPQFSSFFYPLVSHLNSHFLLSTGLRYAEYLCYKRMYVMMNFILTVSKPPLDIAKVHYPTQI